MISYYVVMLLQRFDAVALPNLGPLPVAIKTDAEPHYYLPIFQSREAAVAWNNGSDEHVAECRLAQALGAETGE